MSEQDKQSEAAKYVQPEHVKAARDMAEQQIENAIDQFAHKIPAGEQYKEQAKDAASGVLDQLEQQALNRADDVAEDLAGRVGGFLGGFGQPKKEENKGQ